MTVRRSVAVAAIAVGLLLGLGAAAAAPPPAAPVEPAAVPAADRLQWFREAKFGLFIHWGAYAILGREEWARQLLQIPRDEYRDMALGFDPTAFDPDAWAGLFRQAGAKFVVPVAEHHDGFAMYDSSFSRWTGSTTIPAWKRMLTW